MINWIYNIIFLVIIGFFFLKSVKQSPFYSTLKIALPVKVACSIFIGLLYTYYYQGGDTFNYFEAAEVYKKEFLSDFNSGLDLFFSWQGKEGMIFYFQPRALIVSRIAFFINLFTFSNFWVTSIYLGLFNLICTHIFIKKLHQLKLTSVFAGTVLLFYPSIVFWSSGLLKESIVTGFLFLFLSTFIKLYKREKVRFPEYLIFAVSFVMIYLIKYYVAVLLLPICITTLITSRTKLNRSPSISFFGLFSMLLFCASWLHPNLNFDRFSSVLVNNYHQMLSLSPNSLHIELSTLTPAISSLIACSPEAFLSSFFRPHVFEIHNFTSALAAIENFVFLVSLLFWGIMLITKTVTLTKNSLTIGLTVYIITLATILSLSTPIIGTLARYKVYYLPFIILVIANGLEKLLLTKDQGNE